MNFLHRTWAEIDLLALEENFREIKKLCRETKIMSVVKANAYGHSVSVIAPKLEKLGTDAFAVSNIDEALQLREIGITKPILILGYTPIELAKELSENNISQCVYSLEYARLLSKEAKAQNVNVKIHIKLDTGMSRLGFNFKTADFPEFSDALEAAKQENLILEGIFTHFALADRENPSDNDFTNEQFNLFKKGVELLKEKGLNPEFVHCCNSAALVLDSEKQLDYVRPGVILYGLAPSDSVSEKINLKPVMTLKSVVSMVKEIKKDDTVSYGRTFKAEKTIRTATVAAGYADGYPRLLSNDYYVLINGKKAKILGRICMDQLTVDVSDIPDVKMGDEVILFGKELPVDVLAEKCGTINYEIVCGISPRVPRIIKNA